MAEPFLGELRLMSFGFAPRGWAQCNGQLLPINQNQGLFSLLGTMYGGDGRVNFGLPDLRGRAPLGAGGSYPHGTRTGADAHTISISEVPQHQHVANASSALGSAAIPTGRRLGGINNGYRSPSDLVALQSATISNVGGSQAHENRPPSLVLEWCIALQGIFPSQS